nr:MAG TPA: hypothetical protein [Bacteriophage sp.]
MYNIVSSNIHKHPPFSFAFYVLYYIQYYIYCQVLL